jgi:hypothetical protein
MDGARRRSDDQKTALKGSAAFIDYRSETRHLSENHRGRSAAALRDRLGDESAASRRAPADMWPQAAPGFKVDLYASGLGGPRQIRRAPTAISLSPKAGPVG